VQVVHVDLSFIGDGWFIDSDNRPCCPSTSHQWFGEMATFFFGIRYGLYSFRGLCQLLPHTAWSGVGDMESEITFPRAFSVIEKLVLLLK
jgi:hypothetical protein